MWFTVRELTGWLLLIFGLLLIGVVLTLAVNRAVLEALALSLPATIVFRSGISLLRLMTALRLAEKGEPPLFCGKLGEMGKDRTGRT